MYMDLPVTIAAADLSQAINLVATGFIFVVVILSLLALMTWGGGKIFKRLDSRKTDAQPPVQAPSATDDEHIAVVISAAVHATYRNQQVRVRSIRETSS